MAKARTAAQRAASKRNLAKARAARRASGVKRIPRSRAGREGKSMHRMTPRSLRVRGLTIPRHVADRLDTNVMVANVARDSRRGTAPPGTIPSTRKR